MRVGLALVFFAFAVAPGRAWTQGPVVPQGPEGPASRPREELFRMVDAYIVSNLQESLGLTDQQFVKLLPLVKRLQNDRRAFVQKRQRALAALRGLLQSGAATEARVADLLRELRAVEAEEPALLRKDLEAIDAELSPLQQAKYRVLEVEVQRRLQELMNQVRRQNRPQDRPRREPLEPAR